MRTNNVVVKWATLNQWAARNLDCAMLHNPSDSVTVTLTGRKVESVFRADEDLVQIEWGNQSVFVPEYFVTDIDALARRLVRDGLGASQTSLVEELLKRQVFGIDDIENEQTLRDDDELKEETSRKWNMKTLYAQYEQLDPDEENYASFGAYLEDKCGGTFDFDLYEYREIFEWWPVNDSMLESDLREHGEAILSTHNGTWWGRRTTGQAVYMDSVIQDIARDVANA